MKKGLIESSKLLNFKKILSSPNLATSYPKVQTCLYYSQTCSQKNKLLNLHHKQSY